MSLDYGVFQVYLLRASLSKCNSVILHLAEHSLGFLDCLFQKRIYQSGRGGCLLRMMYVPSLAAAISLAWPQCMQAGAVQREQDNLERNTTSE